MTRYLVTGAQGFLGRYLIAHLLATDPEAIVFGVGRSPRNDLALTHEVGDYLFVHAGVRPGVALGAQRPNDLMWIRYDFLDHRGDIGRFIVHGHTPTTGAPDVRPNRICIDTGAWMTGALTALVLEGESREFLSTG